MGDDLDFTKLLQDAESLTSEIETSTDLPRVQRNLRQVVEAGQLLLSRNARREPGINAEMQASVFLGTKGVDITRMSKKLEPLYKVVSSAEPSQAGTDADLDAFLRSERSGIICSIVDVTSKSFYQDLKEDIRKDLKNSWAIEKEKILASLTGSAHPTSIMDFQDHSGLRNPLYNRKMESTSVLSKTELTYTHEIDLYNKCSIHGLPKPNLLEKFETVAQNTNDKNIQELWTSVAAMISSLPVDPVPSVLEKRSNPRLRKTLIARAKHFLEKAYFTKLQSEVWRNLGRGKLGGVPAVIPIIKHYTNLKNFRSIPGIELGPGESGPVWAIAYLCLRGGKIDDAVKYLRDEVGNHEFAGILAEYAKYEGTSGGFGLPKELEAQLRLEYRRVLKTSSRDLFKKLIYCVLGACDVTDNHSEVASRLDDYLWIKLSQIREVPTDPRAQGDIITYSGFQDMILEKYGEAHFDAFKQPFTYFQALFLTGQFEAAIEFLSRVSHLKSHGIHIAIVLNEMGLLIISDSKSVVLVRVKDDPPGLRRLNYARLIVQYAKTFQGTNTKEALNYLYLLRNIKEHSGVNLFSSCVSDLATESRDFELLFGTISSDGCRGPGILETMGIKTAPVIDYCADQAESNGMLEDAVLLYDLAGKADQALGVLNRLISRQASRKPLPDSPRQRIQQIALVLAERYQKKPPTISNNTVSSSFYILVDFMTFFDEFHGRRMDNALSIIERMRVIPLEKDDIQRCVSNFHSYSDEVRMNIPNLILATMEAIHTKYKKIRLEMKSSFVHGQTPDTKILNELKTKAKTLVTYCGVVPYFMAGDVYTRVMQIEIQIN